MDQPFQFNRLPKTDAWGRPKTIIDKSLFHALFTYDIPPRLFGIFEDGAFVSSSTNAVSEDGMLKMDSTGLTSIEVRSYRHPRYQPNKGILYSASWIIPTWQKDCNHDFGLFNLGQSGLFFRVRSGKAYAVRLTLGVEYVEEIPLPATADLSKGCLYDIQGQWRGIGSFFFYITHNEGTSVHAVSLLGTLDAISIDNPAMHVAMRLEPATEDGLIYCGCIDYTTEGGIQERLQYASAYTLDKSVNAGAGVLAMRLPLLINGVPNTRDVQLVRMSIQADKKSDFSLYVSRDSGAVTATGWTSINTGSYVEETDNISAVNTGLAQFVSVFPVAAGVIVERDNPFPEKIDFYLTAGDVAFIVCESGTGVATTAIFEIGEEI